LATWIVGPSSASGVQGPNPYQAAHVTPGGGLTPYVLPLAPTQVLNNNGIPIDLSLVLGENGVAFVSYPTGTNVVSFNLNTGAVNWSYQPAQSVSSFFYANGGGLTLIDGQSNQIQVDSSGNAGAPVALAPFSSLLPSWIGMWQAELPTSNIPLATISAQLMDWGQSSSPGKGSNPSSNGASVEMPWFPLLDHCTTTPGCIGHYEAIYDALDDLISRLGDPTLSALAQTNIFDKLGNDINGK
jgi:hypothetical protein